MATFVTCTDAMSGKRVLVNLDTVTTIEPGPDGLSSWIRFSGNEQAKTVTETPEQIARGAAR